jgi:hypothetical protein
MLIDPRRKGTIFACIEIHQMSEILTHDGRQGPPSRQWAAPPQNQIVVILLDVWVILNLNPGRKCEQLPTTVHVAQVLAGSKSLLHC